MKFLFDFFSEFKVFDIVEVIFDGIGVGDYNDIVSYIFYLIY